SVHLKWKESKPVAECQAFKDILKYFSKEEWAKLGYSKKVTYVYMKRNYDTMTNLGLRATLPPFMDPNRLATKSQLDESDEEQNPGTQGNPRFINHQKLRERKNLVAYEEISDPEEED
uniref:KRAB-related domain-containing protein n=1 Tax=Loxodonta africana TaxID=9785 RepID=G3SUF7_LOXAF